MYLKEKGLDGGVQIWADDNGNYIGINMNIDMSNGSYDKDDIARWNRATVNFYLNYETAKRLYLELDRTLNKLIRNKRDKEEEGGK